VIASCSRPGEVANCRWLDGTRLGLTDRGMCTCEPMSGICVPPLVCELGTDPATDRRMDKPHIGIRLLGVASPVPSGLVPVRRPERRRLPVRPRKLEPRG
jgi:hypothetical protein